MTPFIIIIIVLIVLGGLGYYFLVANRGSVYERAINLAERGEFTDARGLIRSKLDRNPEDYKSHFYMAQVYALEGNEDNELFHLKEIKRINRFSSEVNPIKTMNRMGEIYYTQEHYRDSFEAYMDAFNYAPNNEEALVYLAFMAAGQGGFEVAEKYFSRLVQVAPNVADYHIARGVSLAMMKSNDSLTELEMGLVLKPHDITAKFLVALQAFKMNNMEKSRETLESLLENINDPFVGHIANRLAVGLHYQNKDYDRALNFAERCLATAVSENWEQEEYDARLSVAYMGMLTGDMEKANDNLLELEIRNPSDDLILKVSDFRMDLEEGLTTVERVSPRGFDFFSHLQDWMRKRFSDDAIYQLSGLKMDDEFDVVEFFTSDKSDQKQSRPQNSGPSFDPDELIDNFNALRGNAFSSACESIIASQGYIVEKDLPYRDKDGADYIAKNNLDKKIKALFRIRQWSNQPISDIFLREMQNKMNELKVSQGFVVAGARLTPGAETASKNLKKITIINEVDFGEILDKILK